MAEKLKRRWIGIEKAPEGYEVLVDRLRREVNLKFMSRLTGPIPFLGSAPFAHRPGKSRPFW